MCTRVIIITCALACSFVVLLSCYSFHLFIYSYREAFVHSFMLLVHRLIN